MSMQNNPLYWIGEEPDHTLDHEVTHIHSVDDLPAGLGGIFCISYQDRHQIDACLKSFYQQPGRWSWCVYVTHETALSKCVTDGIFSVEEALQNRKNIQNRLEAIHDPDTLDPLIGWLGVNRERRVVALKSLESTSIYSYPIIELLFADIYSSYRYATSEQNRGVLEAEQLIDRIRLCPHCHSGHLNYVEVCPSCSSIDIDSQSSIHCFTCGHVNDQQHFLRRGKLECPNCLTQLRHIGVDYDRPLENYICNSCSHRFVEASTLSHCLSCGEKSKPEELVVCKIHQFKLGEAGEYIYQHGKSAQAPELSIKGKVELSFFQNLLEWVNRVALRHKEQHLLLGLHLPGLHTYREQHGDAKLFSFIDQLTTRLSSLLRDTDICCQFKQDLLLILLPNTANSSLPIVQQKLSELSELFEDTELELNVFSRALPDSTIADGIDIWLESLMSEIYVTR